METLDVRALLAPMQRSELQAIADQLGLPQTRNLIPELVGFLSDEEAVRTAVGGLSAEAVDLLRDFALLLPALHFDPTQKLLKKTPPALEELLRYGLVGRARTYWASETLVLPKESLPIVRRYAFQKIRSSLAPSACAAAERIESKLGTFQRNVSTILATAQERGLTLTRDGEIAKPFLKRALLPFLEFSDGASGASLETDSGVKVNGKGSDERTAGERYPAELEEAWSFCKLFELVRIDAGKATLSDHGQSFLQASDETVIRAIRLHLAVSSSIAEPDWVYALLGDGSWIPVAELVPRLTSGLYPDKHRVTAQSEWKLLIGRMVKLGILEQGLAGDRVVVRLGYHADNGAATARTRDLYVTPDFKVSAPRNLDTSVRHRIFRFAALVKADVMDQWELSRSTIADALDAGWTGASIVNFLSEHSAVPLPQNVAESIIHWERDHTNVRFYHGPVLILDDPAERRLVLQVAEAERAVLAAPAPNVLLLHPARADSVIEAIRRRRAVAKLSSRDTTTGKGDFEEVLKSVAKRFELGGGK